MSNEKLHLAVLDDYQDIAKQRFAHLQGRIAITIFNDAINPSSPTGLEMLVQRLRPFAIISTMRERTPFPATLLSKLPNLKLLLTTGPRNAAIDLEACKKHGIVVAGTGVAPPPRGNPSYSKPDTTTTHTWALILALSRHVVRDHNSVVNGGWQGQTLATPLSGKILGLVGLGRLGAAVGRIAVQAWGMRVLAWSPNLTEERVRQQAEAQGLEAGDFEFVDKKTLFRESDVLNVQLVLSGRTRGIIGAEELNLMKREALFINTSRGPLVDEAALLKVCADGTIAGVALDVFDVEPLAEDSPWRRKKWGSNGMTEVLLSPHMGYGQKDVIESWYEQNAANLQRWLDGKELQARL